MPAMMANLNPTPTATFSYDSLSREDRELRLVRFSNSASSTEVELILHRVSLNDPPSYHALSYVWGDPTPTRSIRVNGRPLPVAHNLHQALLDVRRGGDAQEWLWVDAICINQDNPEERSRQVAQMGHIFGRAALVYIWLGPSGDDSDAVLRMAQRIGADAHRAGVADLWFGWQSFKYRLEKLQEDAESVERRESFLAQALDDEELRSPRLPAAIESLLNRPNWCRAWIVQEIALARDGLVLCGAERVSLDAFDAALATIFFCKNGDFARGHPRWRDFGAGLNNNLFRLRGLVARRQRRRNQKAGLLEFLLSDFLGAPGRPFYMASDPRDIIFGLLGVAADTERLGLRPDYTQTVAEVYTAATRAMVERCPQYSLDYCAFPKDMDDLPTWVPDWQRVGRFGLAYGRPMSYRNLFNSSADRVQPPPTGLFPTPAEGIPAWRVLRQRGCSVDVVATVFAGDEQCSCTEPALTLSRALAWQGEQRTRILQAILKFAIAAHLELDGAQLETVLWRTVVADFVSVERCTVDYDALAVRIYRQQPVPVATLTEAQVGFMLRNTYPFPHRPDAIATQVKVDEYSGLLLRIAAATCRGRTLFATAGGRLGLGPENVQTGDVVTILLGTPVPIVLRPAADRFRYVGDAYVHGIMDGQLMKGDPLEEDFDIA
ncbi:heterokaryon incompatibility protein-domain-containing protein [Parachaetomium inaequale]|uniref:Heterokaryon incompatibility protein-domain-containing protein n=1 Tax=Parachaetomium inaequale TaxID=2588326 RepID=A0AAN6SM93_9PEZI|nr:heterokaryon incompatibility protein-domain-containing protein [Parachaetomium inaequale]